MKNIHLLPTDKPSRLSKHSSGTFHIVENKPHKKGLYKMTNQHIYITSSDEKVKEGDWHLHYYANKAIVGKSTKASIQVVQSSKDYKKVVLTTDQTLISDGVQAIDDEFLRWFVANQSCDYVETRLGFIQSPDNTKDGFYYKILIPQEKFKQPVEEGKEIPSDAHDIEVFYIKPDEKGKLFAYVGYKISNGNFHFTTVPYTNPEAFYTKEDLRKAYMQGYNRGIDNNPNDLENYINHIVSTKEQEK